MSVKIIAGVWELNLPLNQKLVLLAMADDADDENRCYLSVPRIAWKTGLSDRQVQRIQRKLRAAGLIVLLNYGQGGRGKAAVYQLVPQNGVKLSASTPSQRQQ